MKLTTIVGLLLAGIACGGCASAPQSTPPKELKLVNLMTQALSEEFVPGREVVISYVEIPPNTTMERHWHPGEEFQYYLEGEAELRIDGEPTIFAKPGGVGHVPYKKMHTAVTGAKGAKAIVFRVHTHGEPVRYLEEGGSSER